MTPSAALALLLSLPGTSEFVRLDAALEPRPVAQDLLAFDDEPKGFLEQGLHDWPVGTTLLQGYIGVFFLDEGRVSGGVTPPLDVADAFEMLPTMGGVGQYKLGGSRVSWGIEGGVDFSGRAGGAAFYFANGVGQVAVEVDLYSLALAGGPFVSVPLGEKLRVYAGGGGLMQWTWYDQVGPSTNDSGDGDGFGAGYYARGGFEYLLPNSTLMGLGARWSETRVDLSGGLGHVDLVGTQVLLTITRSL